MRLLLRWITESFIATFGITRPRPGEEERAGLLILLMMLAIACVLATVTYLLLHLWWA